MEQTKILRRARDYLDQIYWGRDPLTGEKLPADTVLRDKTVCKQLRFAARDLERIVTYDSGQWRTSFAPNPKRRPWVKAGARSVSIKKMTMCIDETGDRIETRSITPRTLMYFLTNRGFVRPEEEGYVPTPEGCAIGLMTNQKGEVCFPPRRSSSCWITWTTWPPFAHAPTPTRSRHRRENWWTPERCMYAGTSRLSFGPFGP